MRDMRTSAERAVDSALLRLRAPCTCVPGRSRCPEVDVDLYASGREARDAGMAGVEHPGSSARRAIERLTRKGVGR